jgi:hypothetical protein
VLAEDAIKAALGDYQKKASEKSSKVEEAAASS